MFIIIMMAVIDDYRRFKVSNRIIIAGMVIGVVVNMGNSVTSIGYSAFNECSGLSTIAYKGITYTNKTQLTSALTSNGVSLENHIFDNTKLQ